MKILHVTPAFYPCAGGIETFVYESSKRLVERGHDVNVITSDKTFDGKLLPKHQTIEGIKVLRVSFNSILRYNTSFEAIKEILDFNYDFLHVHGVGFFSDLIPILKIIKNRTIFLHTHGGIFHTEYASTLKKIYFNTITRINLNFADRIIAHSIHDKELFGTICDDKKISLIPYGIDWKYLSKMKRTSDGKTLVYIGRLAKNKRLDRLFNILFYVKKKIPKIKLLLIGGDYGEKDKLLKLGKELRILDNVQFTGVVQHEKISRYLSKSDLFLLSSDYEGFGICVIEAMAAGLPVIVNSIPSMKEIVTNEKDGYILNFDEYEKVSHIICELLTKTSIKKKIGNEAKKTSEKYDWGKSVSMIEQLYKKH